MSDKVEELQARVEEDSENQQIIISELQADVQESGRT